MKTLLIGIGAAGNKAAMSAIMNGIVEQEDVIIINSTSKDFPSEFEGTKIILSPNDTGCGKERAVANDYAKSAIKNGKLNIEAVNKYTTIICITSVEGGTGSGATPIIAQFFNQVYRKNVHIIAFTGFEEDVRGLGNTIEFFQEVDSNLIVQTIRNSAFLRLSGYNKFKAEQLANEEMCKRIRILTGQDFIISDQNIDDTDILKVSNTSGYMTVEHIMIDKPLVDQDDYNKLIKKMIYDSKSTKSKNPCALRIGAIFNIDPATEDAIDYSFQSILDTYGFAYERFIQKQWDGKKEYIAFIVSGMQMPIEEMRAVYERYKEGTERVNKNADAFYNEMKGMALESVDKKFDMIKPAQSGLNIEDFLKQHESSSVNGKAEKR